MIRCIKLRRYEKNTLRAFVDLELSRVGLVLHDCTWHEKNGQGWVGLPAKSYETKNLTAWQPIIEFANGAKEARKQFQEKALEAIHSAAAQQEHDVEGGV